MRGMAEASQTAPVVILNAPQLAENIGAVARVMANFGLSELRLPILTPREAAGELHAAASAGQAVGILFGGERAGLETRDIALSQGVITIPIDPKFRSLNLAQAVAINAYEWWATALDAPPPLSSLPCPA